MPRLHAGAMQIRERVEPDAVEPGPKIPFGVEGGQSRKGFQERLLSHVFRFMAIVRKVKEPAEQAVPIAIDQVGIRLPIAALRSKDQIDLIFRNDALGHGFHEDVTRGSKIRWRENLIFTAGDNVQGKAGGSHRISGENRKAGDNAMMRGFGVGNARETAVGYCFVPGVYSGGKDYVLDCGHIYFGRFGNNFVLSPGSEQIPTTTRYRRRPKKGTHFPSSKIACQFDEAIT